MEIESELKELEERAEELVAHLSAEEIYRRKLDIELLLSDYDFLEPYFVNEKGEELVDDPVAILSRDLNSPLEPEITDRTCAESYALLVLFMCEHREDFEPNRFASILRLAITQANNCDERARTAEFRERSRNAQKSIALNDKRHALSRRLKEIAFREYELARRELLAARGRATYKEIAAIVWPKMKPFNFNPGTKKPIIAQEDPGNERGEADRALTKWFMQGVRDKKLTSPKKKN